MRSRKSAGAVTSNERSSLIAAVRALTAPARVVCRARMASTIPVPSFGVTVALSDKTVSAAA